MTDILEHLKEAIQHYDGLFDSISKSIAEDSKDGTISNQSIDVSAITDLQYENMIDKLEYKTYEPNQQICKANDMTAPALYLVVDGKAARTGGSNGGTGGGVGGGNGTTSFNGHASASWVKGFGKGDDDDLLSNGHKSFCFGSEGGQGSPKSLKSKKSNKFRSGTKKPEDVTFFGEDLLFDAEFRKTKSGKLIQNLIMAPYSVQAGSTCGCRCAVLSAHAFREATHYGREGDSINNHDEPLLAPKSPTKSKPKAEVAKPSSKKLHHSKKGPKTPKTPKSSSKPSVKAEAPMSPSKAAKSKTDLDVKLHQGHRVGGKSKHKDHLGEERPRPPPFNIFQEELPGDISEFIRPVHAKTEKEKQVIKHAMKDKVLLKHLSEKTKDNLALALEKSQVQSGMVIVKQGDTDDVYYVVSKGECEAIVDGKKSTKKQGESFGEEALTTRTPSKESIHAKTDVEVFKVDQKTYRQLLQKDAVEFRQRKLDLLNNTGFLQHVTAENMEKLVDIMEPRTFRKGELICRKEKSGQTFLMVDEGELVCTGAKKGGKDEEIKLGPGEHIGRQVLVDIQDSYTAEVVGSKPGIVYEINQNDFHAAIGSFLDLIPVEDKTLGGITGLQHTPGEFLRQEEILRVRNCIYNTTYEPGDVIVEHGVEMEAAVYFIRDGTASYAKGASTSTKGRRFPTILHPGNYFGEELFLGAREADTLTCVSKYHMTANTKCVVGTLLISDYYNALGDTFDDVQPDVQPAKSTKKSAAASTDTHKKSSRRTAKWPKCNIALSDLERRIVLGQGNFGQVWLVADKTGKKIKKPCVLKIQSKHDLVKKGKASVCIEEKQLLQKLNCPFIVDLVNAYQDKGYVYMLLEYLPGGELYNIMNPWEPALLPEPQAKFYILGIADAFAYIHSKKIIFRDLKPENVMIDKNGYPKLIDFGFAKIVESKTFTLCGTPGYLAPEVVLNIGHGKAVDHWQVGVLIYDMLSYESPFYNEEMDQMEQFRCVVDDPVPKIEDPVSPEVWDLILKLLEKDPKKRLGSLKKGEHDILHHKWFKDLSLSELRKKTITAPWLPNVEDPFDTSNFEDWSDLDDITKTECPELTPEQAALFEKF